MIREFKLSEIPIGESRFLYLVEKANLPAGEGRGWDSEGSIYLVHRKNRSTYQRGERKTPLSKNAVKGKWLLIPQPENPNLVEEMRQARDVKSQEDATRLRDDPGIPASAVTFVDEAGVTLMPMNEMQVMESLSRDLDALSIRLREPYE